MARMKQYDKGYLEGQLDSAENELDSLYIIRETPMCEFRPEDEINVRIKDIEDFLKEHGRFKEVEQASFDNGDDEETDDE